MSRLGDLCLTVLGLLATALVGCRPALVHISAPTSPAADPADVMEWRLAVSERLNEHGRRLDAIEASLAQCGCPVPTLMTLEVSHARETDHAPEMSGAARRLPDD